MKHNPNALIDVQPNQDPEHLVQPKWLTNLQVGVLSLEVSPANELLRYGAFAFALQKTGDPVIAGIVLGAANMAIESGAAVVTPPLLETERGSKVLAKLARKGKGSVDAEKKGKSLNIVAEAGIAYFGGTAVVQLARKTVDNSITVEEGRKRGLITAGCLSAVLTAQGILLSNSIESPSAGSIATGVVGVAGSIAALYVAKNVASRDEPALNAEATK